MNIPPTIPGAFHFDALNWELGNLTIRTRQNPEPDSDEVDLNDKGHMADDEKTPTLACGRVKRISTKQTRRSANGTNGSERAHKSKPPTPYQRPNAPIEEGLTGIRFPLSSPRFAKAYEADCWTPETVPADRMSSLRLRAWRETHSHLPAASRVVCAVLLGRFGGAPGDREIATSMLNGLTDAQLTTLRSIDALVTAPMEEVGWRIPEVPMTIAAAVIRTHTQPSGLRSMGS